MDIYAEITPAAYDRWELGSYKLWSEVSPQYIKENLAAVPERRNCPVGGYNSTLR